MADKKRALYGWYSEQQAAMCGTAIYERLGGGGEVEITCVSDTSDHGCAWPDMKFVGEVTEYVRQGKPDPWRQGKPDPWGFLDAGFDYDDMDDIQ